jgi:ShK domain-like
MAAVNGGALGGMRYLVVLYWLLLVETLAKSPEGPAIAASCSRQQNTYHSNVTSDYLGAVLATGECVDTHEMCSHWAEQGECKTNDGYMLEACPCSCHSCPTFIEHDWDDEPQIAFGPLKEEIDYIIIKTENYMKEAVYPKNSRCRNKHRGCSQWSLLGATWKFNIPWGSMRVLTLALLLALHSAFSGECELNPRFMLEDCGPACQACHRIVKHR